MPQVATTMVIVRPTEPGWLVFTSDAAALPSSATTQLIAILLLCDQRLTAERPSSLPLHAIAARSAFANRCADCYLPFSLRHRRVARQARLGSEQARDKANAEAGNPGAKPRWRRDGAGLPGWRGCSVDSKAPD